MMQSNARFLCGSTLAGGPRTILAHIMAVMLHAASYSWLLASWGKLRCFFGIFDNHAL